MGSYWTDRLVSDAGEVNDDAIKFLFLIARRVLTKRKYSPYSDVDMFVDLYFDGDVSNDVYDLILKKIGEDVINLLAIARNKFSSNEFYRYVKNANANGYDDHVMIERHRHKMATKGNDDGK